MWALLIGAKVPSILRCTIFLCATKNGKMLPANLWHMLSWYFGKKFILFVLRVLKSEYYYHSYVYYKIL